MTSKLFDAKSRPHGTVVLNWHGKPEEEFTFFAEAFHLTAKEAVATLRTDPHFGLHGSPHKDFRAYPIVFLYRHALELYLKAAILAGGPMVSIRGAGTVAALRKTHSLEALRQDVERIFRAFEWGDDIGLPRLKTLEDFRKVIAELEGVDSRSDAFRYPLDAQGAAALGSHFRFNLFELCDTLDGLLRLLHGAASAACDGVQATYEAMGEARQAELENSAYEPE